MEVRHQRLRSLTIFDFMVPVLPKLNCPSLEDLSLRGLGIPRQYLERIQTTCPKKLTVHNCNHLYEIESDLFMEARGIKYDSDFAYRNAHYLF